MDKMNDDPFDFPTFLSDSRNIAVCRSDPPGTILPSAAESRRVGVGLNPAAIGRLVMIAAIVFLAAHDAWASSCPYCGRSYGAAAPGDGARIAALRAQHEASCSARPSGGSSGGTLSPPAVHQPGIGTGGRMPRGGTSSPPAVHQPSAAELARQRALAANNAGVDLYNQRRFKEAEAQFRKALEDAPHDSAIKSNIKSNLAILLHRQGSDAAREGNYAAAVSFYEAALALVSDDDDDDDLKTDALDLKESLRYARNRLQEEEERRRQAVATRLQLDESRDRISSLLDALAANNAQGGGALFDGRAGGPAGPGGGLGFGTTSQGAVAAAGGETGATPAVGGLAFGSTDAAFVDASVVDLRHLDPDAPTIVDIGVVRGTGGATIENPSGLRTVIDSPEGVTGTENPRTAVLLDALEAGDSDWEASFAYLDEAMRRFPDDPVIPDTYQFLLGMVSVGEVIDYPGREERLDRDLVEQVLGGSADPFEGLDYETWSLVRRAQRADETGQARDLWRQASERIPDNRRLRDIYNFVDGVWAIRNSGF